MQILLILLFILPFLYKTFFWLYTIQLKDYRWDRFKEYILTPQGKRAILNFWFIIELPILLFSLMVYSSYNLEAVIFRMLFYLFILENIFVVGKIFRKKIMVPVFTSRTIIILILFLIIIGILIYATFYKSLFYFLILFILVFVYLFIGLTNIILLPIINYEKNKIIKNAIIKSKELSKPIKIGITGSVGKSSVKEYLAYILSKEDNTINTPNNINSELGVSKFILEKLKNEYKYFVAELGAYKIGEIKLLGKIVNHKYGFLTGIGNQHLGLFGSIENTIKGKSEIMKKVLKNNGVLYVNYDNKNVKKINFPKDLRYVKYGVESDNLDAKSEIVKVKNGKTLFEFNYKGHKCKFSTYLLGKHNIVNLTGVIAFSIDMGISIEKLKEYIKELRPLKDTLKIIEIDDSFIIDDSYNLSEDGLFAGLEVLSTFKGNRILVLDDIIELGKNAKKIHYNIGKKIGKSGMVDKILYAGVNYQKDFLYGLSESGFSFDNIITDLDKIKAGDIILLEGKGSKKYFN